MGESSTECSSTLWLNHQYCGWADNHRHCWWWWFFKVSPNLGFAREFLRGTLVREGWERAGVRSRWVFSSATRFIFRFSTYIPTCFHWQIAFHCTCILLLYLSALRCRRRRHCRRRRPPNPPPASAAGEPPSDTPMIVSGLSVLFSFPPFCFHFPKQSNSSGTATVEEGKGCWDSIALGFHVTYIISRSRNQLFYI